jgi:hypothetical protein
MDPAMSPPRASSSALLDQCLADILRNLDNLEITTLRLELADEQEREMTTLELLADDQGEMSPPPKQSSGK